MEHPRHALIEYERRWLFSPEKAERLPLIPFFKTLHDRYLRCGRLRLRDLTESDTGRRVLKLTKKYAPLFPDALPYITTPLEEAEFQALATLACDELRKERRYFDHQEVRFSVDLFEGPLAGLVLCSIELETLEHVRSIQAPPGALEEVTSEPFFTGGSLCKITRSQLAEELHRRGLDVLQG